MNRLVLLLGIIAAGLVLLIVNRDSGQTFGISNDDFGHIVYLLPIATLIGTGVLASRQDLGRNLRYLGIWILIGLATVTAYVYKDDAQNLTNRVVAELIPGHPVVLTGLNGQSEVVIRRTSHGHFAVNAQVDGRTLAMLIDTGASRVALTWRDAQSLGLHPEKMNFSMEVTTANGKAHAALVRLDRIAIGPIVRHDVSATVAEKGKLDASLLGMNFLSSLSAIRMEPDEMRLMD